MSYVSVNYTGGIGNQLFYIAIGHYYANKYNKNLILPNKIKTGNKNHEESILYTLFKNKIKLLDENIIYNICDTKIKDDIYHDGNILLLGMFQKLKYVNYSKEYIFDIISNSIYYENALKHFDKIKKYFNDNNINNYLLIHIRRTDFLEDYSDTNINYYIEAYKKYFTDNINVLIFSDDIEWCKYNIKLNNIYYVDDINYYKNENENTIVSLCLMTMIKKAILNESTFGWWSGILGDENKIIVVPKNRITIIHDNIDDIYPKSWIKFNMNCFE